MQEKASVTPLRSKEDDDPAAAAMKMAGDLIPPEEGQELHFGFIYETVVVCPCGKCPQKSIVELEDGDVVLITNFPRKLREGYGLPEKIEAVHYGGWDKPAFKPMNDSGISGELTFSYDKIFYHMLEEKRKYPGTPEVIFTVRRTIDHNIGEGC